MSLSFRFKLRRLAPNGRRAEGFFECDAVLLMAWQTEMSGLCVTPERR